MDNKPALLLQDDKPALLLQDGCEPNVLQDALVLKVDVDEGDHMTYVFNDESITIKREPGTAIASSSASVTIVDYTDHFPPSTADQQHSDQSAATGERNQSLPDVKGIVLFSIQICESPVNFASELTT